MDSVQPGDVVQLKSGGPLMTVRFVERGRACCTWFDGGKPSERMFELAALRKVEEGIK